MIAFFFSEKLFAQTPNFNWFPAAGAGTPVCAPATLIFIGGYTGSPAPTSWSWNFGAGAVPQTSNQQNPGLVNFTTCGTYNVTLTINGTISITQTVVIHCNPSACFIAMPSFGIVPTIVDFNSSCSQTTCQLSYQWDFGDAASSSLANPIHIYIDTGCFNIVMIVTDCNGCENDTMVLNAVCIAEPSSSLYNFVDNNFSFEIIPNPSDGNFSLEFSNSCSSEMVEVLNLLGEKILETKSFGQKKISLHLSDIADGIYFLRVTCNGDIFQRKIVVKK